MPQNWRDAPPARESQISDLEVSCTGGIVDRVRIDVKDISELSASIMNVSRDISGERDL